MSNAKTAAPVEGGEEEMLPAAVPPVLWIWTRNGIHANGDWCHFPVFLVFFGLPP
jgi:hypothetical protein